MNDSRDDLIRILGAAITDLEHAALGEESDRVREVLADLRRARDNERAAVESKCAELQEIWREWGQQDQLRPIRRDEEGHVVTPYPLTRGEWDTGIGALTKRANAVEGTVQASWRTGKCRARWREASIEGPY